MCSIVIHAIFVDAVEKSRQAVVVALGHRIEFMVMTPATLERESQKSGAESMDTVGYVFIAPFFFDTSTFVGLAMKAIKSGCQALLASCARQQVAGQLLGQEAVVREIGIESLDDPIAIWPGGAKLITLISVAIRITRSVEPGNGHSLAEMFRGEESVNNGFISRCRFVFDKSVNLFRSRWESD